MTEIEEKFFEVFGIEKQLEPKALCQINKLATCEHCIYYDNGKCKSKQHYPEITSDILLKLICILVQWDRDYEYLITSKFIDDLKQEVLNDCIQSAKQFDEYYVEQVKSLFTEVGK